MSVFKLEQSFKDEFVSNNYEIYQSVSIDLKENWVYLNHNGDEFSMSLPAYKKFIELNHDAIVKADNEIIFNEINKK